MEREILDLLEKEIGEGKTENEVRAALISNGHSTDGLAAEYVRVKEELGIVDEPKEETAEQPFANAASYENFDELAKKRGQVSKQVSFKNVLKLAGFFVFVVCMGIVLFAYWDDLWEVFGRSSDTIEHNMSAGDVLIEGQMSRLALSAKTYRSRLQSYDGLCSSIGLDHEKFACSADDEDFFIETKLSDGSYYCIDGAGFSGIVASAREETLLCTE